MPLAQLEAEAVRRQLDVVLKSSGFARNERLSRFLRFIVDWHLEGRDRELKECVIGVEVFGRSPDYDPKFDPVVRTEARRLRARLAAYYKSAGAENAVVIDLPKGGYVPVVRVESNTSESLTQGPTPVLAGTPSPLKRWRLAPLAFAGLAVVLAAVGWTRLGPFRRARSASNSAAYDLYLRARASEKMPALSGAEASVDLFERAIAKDPSFAPAYAGLGAMEAGRSGFDRFNPAERAEMIAKGWAAAEKAIQLDSQLADAHGALGMMQARQGQWKEAERSFRRAVELAPRDPLWRYDFAVFLLLPVGRIEEAVEQLRSAEEFDPGSRETHYALGNAFKALGRFDDAQFHCDKAAGDDKDLSVCWGETLFHQGKTGEAVRMLESTWSGHLLEMRAQSLGVAYARAGRREDAERIAALAPRPTSKAVIFAALGDKERTLETLDQMAPTGPGRIGRLLIEPDFAFLRGDPRLKAIRMKVGLPE
jgi:tetratricopeptide (TPR) repeat protein